MNRDLKLLKYIPTLILFTQSHLSHAEFDLISKNQFDPPSLAPLSLEFGGQLRPQWVHNVGPEPSYYKNGHDGASRVRLTAKYALSPETELKGYYEHGLNVPKLLGMNGHFDPAAKSNQRRQAYISIANKRYGTLSYGQQFGLYYSVIGSKSDVWDNDALVSATTTGVNGHYDGANRAKNSLMYTKEIDKFKIYANYLFSEKAIPTGGKYEYKRRNGGGLGLDYAATADLTYSLAASTTKADVTLQQDPNHIHDYQQNVVGSAITFKPNDWYLVTTASYYHDFVPAMKYKSADHFFAGDGYGLEAFAGYTFKLDLPYLKSIQPYVAVDTLQLKSEQNFRSNHQYIGFNTEINKKLKIMTEHTFASNSNHDEQDSTWVTMFLSF